MTSRATVAVLWLLALPPLLEAQTESLAYVARYDKRAGTVDHLMGVEVVFDHYALVSSNLSLTLVDLDDLTAAGTTRFVDRLRPVDVMTTTTRDDGICFANQRLGGFAVIAVDPLLRKLRPLAQVAEPGVYFEKMAVAGDRLYVAAHAYGIRIYDVATPAQPQLIASLAQGFTDAWAVAVHDSMLYVADGAGGLKVVDVSDETAPVIVWGETPDSAPATAQDVAVVGDHVLVASGGAGIAVHSLADPAERVLFDTPISARQLAVSGDLVAVADTGGLQAFRIATDGSLRLVASEKGQRRSLGGEEVSLRIWSGVAIAAPNRILVADWDSMDLYDLVTIPVAPQPDITASTQRLRFAPAGGSLTVQLTNQGTLALHVTDVQSTQPTFSARPSQFVLAPGATQDLVIDYDGGAPGIAVLHIDSDDPDEAPLPIQLLGATATLDPGEVAADFTLDAETFDHATRQFSTAPFQLAAHTGEVAVIATFGTW